MQHGFLSEIVATSLVVPFVFAVREPGSDALAQFPNPAANPACCFVARPGPARIRFQFPPAACYAAIKRLSGVHAGHLIPMRSSHNPYPVAFSRKSWTGSFVRSIAPRRHLCVLPTRTRPSLFGSD
jgi:hypothetical protein